MDMLEKARQTINEVDAQMVKLFEKRMQAVEMVATYKKQHQIPVLDEQREQEVIRNNVERIQNEMYKQGYQQLLEKMMEISRNYQHIIIQNEKREELYAICKEKGKSCTD